MSCGKTRLISHPSSDELTYHHFGTAMNDVHRVGHNNSSPQQLVTTLHLWSFDGLKKLFINLSGLHLAVLCH